jgi:LAGLIDADG DNA endonuclease family protein
MLMYTTLILKLLVTIKTLLNELIKSEKQKELAWAGGFIDGEGCITAVYQTYKPVDGKKRNGTTRLKLMVNQNCWSTINRLQKILNENSSLTEMKMQLGMNAKAFMLQYDGRHALNAINKLMPYLHRKHQHAVVANALWTEGQLGQKRGGRKLDPELVKIRKYYVNRLRKLH